MMKKRNGKLLLSLLVLGFLLSCTQAPEQIAEKGKDATVRLFTEDTKGKKSSIGSGFFVRPNQIATNIHVVSNLQKVPKVLAKLIHAEKWYTIEGVTAFDVQNDLVVLETVEGGAKYLPLGNSDAVQIGDSITVIGSPHRIKWSPPGEDIRTEMEEGKESEGIIDTPSIKVNSDWFHVAAEVWPGNSGGPVLNSDNEVVGIHSQSSHGPLLLESAGFAIPSNELKTLLKRLEPPESLARWQTKKPIRACTFLTSAYFKRASMPGKKDLSLYEETIKDLDKAIDLYSKFARAHYLRGHVNLELSRYQEAIEDFNNTIALRPDFASAHYGRGDAILGLSEGEASVYAAIEDFNKAIELSPDATDIDSWGNSAIMKLSKGVPGKREAASLYTVIKDLSNNIELTLDSTDTSDIRWKRHRVGLKQHWEKLMNEELTDEELERYEARWRSNDARILIIQRGHLTIQRGHAKYILGLSEEVLEKREAVQSLNAAIKDFNEALKLGDFPAAYYRRGLAYEALGQQEEAKADFEKAKELDPDVGK